MKKLTLSVLTMATLALTACGGSDGGSVTQSVAAQPATTTPTNTTTQPTPAVSIANATYTGQAVQLDDNRVSTQAIGTNDINKLMVNGQSYEVTTPNINAASFTNIKSGNYHNIASGSHLSYAKYGYYDDERTDQEYFYYQGQKTPMSSMPTVGLVIYEGLAVHECDNCDDPVTGTSNFRVNFGEKTLTGNITTQRGQVDLSANITNNEFSGINSQGTTTTGAFFGTSASELSGVYTNPSQDYAGAFGAKRTTW